MDRLTIWIWLLYIVYMCWNNTLYLLIKVYNYYLLIWKKKKQNGQQKKSSERKQQKATLRIPNFWDYVIQRQKYPMTPHWPYRSPLIPTVMPTAHTLSTYPEAGTTYSRRCWQIKAKVTWAPFYRQWAHLATPSPLEGHRSNTSSSVLILIGFCTSLQTKKETYREKC